MRWIMLIKGACICGFYVLQAMAFFAYRREAKKVDRNNPHNSILRYLMAIELWVFMLFTAVMIHHLAS